MKNPPDPQNSGGAPLPPLLSRRCNMYMLKVQLMKMNVKTLAIYRCKMAFFKRAWLKVKVPSLHRALGLKLALIRPLK